MILIGEDFNAASVSGTQNTAVAGPMQIEGDAPNRGFQVQVRNTGVGVVTVRAQESVNGTIWTASNDRANSGAAGIANLASGAQGGFNFFVGGNASWFRLVAVGVTTLVLKLKSFTRPPVNV